MSPRNAPAAGQAILLLAQPDRSTRRGRRDATLLATLYDTAARVSEFAGLTVLIAPGASSASSAYSSIMMISAGISGDIFQARLPAAASNAARASSTTAAP